MKKCMNCGAELPEEASFCPYCTVTQNEKHQVVPRWPRRKWLWIAGGSVVVMVGMILGIWLFPSGIQSRETGSLPESVEAVEAETAAPSPAAPAEAAVPLSSAADAEPVSAAEEPVLEDTDDIGFLLNTTVDIRTELQSRAQNDGSQELFLHLEPRKDGLYIFNIAGTPLVDAAPVPGGIDLLNNPMVEASGMYGVTWGMHAYMFTRCFKLEADQTYDFCIWVPAAELDLTWPVTARIATDWDFADDVMYDMNVAVNDTVHGGVNLMLGEFVAIAEDLELDESYDSSVVSVMWNPQQKNDLLITGLSGGTTEIHVQATFMGETKTVTFTVTVFDGAGGAGAAAGPGNGTLRTGNTDGPPDLYPVPQPGWPEEGTDNEKKIIYAQLKTDGKTVRSDPMDIRSELAELSDDWYVAYLTVTPRQDAVYRISVDIDEGYLVDAEQQPMPQTFRSVENAQWVTGGCAFNGGSRDIHLADHYRLYAGNAYHFQLLLCRHGIDYGKEVVMQVSQEV